MNYCHENCLISPICCNYEFMGISRRIVDLWARSRSTTPTSSSFAYNSGLSLRRDRVSCVFRARETDSSVSLFLWTTESHAHTDSTQTWDDAAQRSVCLFSRTSEYFQLKKSHETDRQLTALTTVTDTWWQFLTASRCQSELCLISLTSLPLEQVSNNYDLSSSSKELFVASVFFQNFTFLLIFLIFLIFLQCSLTQKSQLSSIVDAPLSIDLFVGTNRRYFTHRLISYVTYSFTGYAHRFKWRARWQSRDFRSRQHYRYFDLADWIGCCSRLCCAFNAEGRRSPSRPTKVNSRPRTRNAGRSPSQREWSVLPPVARLSWVNTDWNHPATAACVTLPWLEPVSLSFSRPVSSLHRLRLCRLGRGTPTQNLSFFALPRGPASWQCRRRPIAALGRQGQSHTACHYHRVGLSPRIDPTMNPILQPRLGIKKFVLGLPPIFLPLSPFRSPCHRCPLLPLALPEFPSRQLLRGLHPPESCLPSFLPFQAAASSPPLRARA